MEYQFDYNTDIENMERGAEPFGRKTDCEAFVSRQYPDEPEAVWQELWEEIKDKYDCYAIGVAIGSNGDTVVPKDVARSIESKIFDAVEDYIYNNIHEEISPSLQDIKQNCSLQ